MMEQLIQKLNLRYWNLTRILRVGFGIAFIISGAVSGEGLMAVLGALVFLQGIFNVGCGACVPPPASAKEDSTETKYEVLE